MIRPKDVLLNGVRILEPVLLPNGFDFHLRAEGKGSGGEFAWGEFVQGDRKLELHVRRSLGLVRYHVGDQSASHESYMRELGVWGKCRYPGFSDNPNDAFEGLAHDLGFVDGFLRGSADILHKAAAKEAVNSAQRDETLMAGYVGDTDRLERLRQLFRERRYADVLHLATGLKNPERMTESERRMVEIARERTGR